MVKTTTNKSTAENDVVKTATSELTTENDVVQTATNETTEGDKTPSDNVTSFDLDISHNPYILTPPPIQSPPKLLNHRLSLLDIFLEKWEDTTYDLIRDLMSILTFECLIQLLRRTHVQFKTRLKNSVYKTEPEWPR